MTNTMTAPKFMLGRKLGMTQVFHEDGSQIPVTVISAGPCTVSQIKTAERDGYLSLQVAFEPCREKVLSKAQVGHLKSSDLEAHRVLAEVRIDEASELELGAEFKVDVFESGDRVDVIGMVKGRGFQGVIRAHNFSGNRKTHGGMARRRPGAIGQHSQPGEVMKGKKMATHWGAEQATTRNLKVVEVDAENNVLVLRGSVPGCRGALVTIRAASAYKVPQKA